MTVSARASQELPTHVPASHGPTTGFVGQFTLFAALGAGVGLGAAGWVVGTAYAVVVWALLSRAMHRSGARVLGPANARTSSVAWHAHEVHRWIAERPRRQIGRGQHEFRGRGAPKQIDTVAPRRERTTRGAR